MNKQKKVEHARAVCTSGPEGWRDGRAVWRAEPAELLEGGGRRVVVGAVGAVLLRKPAMETNERLTWWVMCAEGAALSCPGRPWHGQVLPQLSTLKS